jgi:hypothetical protein
MERGHQVGRHQNRLIFRALPPADFADHRYPFFNLTRPLEAAVKWVTDLQ